MNIWLVDHGGFYNRGCEAIVRSTMDIVRSRLGACRFTLWSRDPQGDATQLQGEPVQVRDVKRLPLLIWDFPYRIYGGLKRRGWPGKRIARAVVRNWPSVPRCVLSVGGDNFSLDYGRPERHVQVGRFFLDLGVPYVIWGASVGPFTADPEFEEVMRGFLHQVDLITAREELTVDYLRSLGVTRNVRRVWDPAFALEPEPYDGKEAAFVAGGNVLGLNLSALIVKWLPDNNVERMLRDAQRFVEAVVAQGMHVLLVPHVTKRLGDLQHDDERLLKMLVERIELHRERVALLPGDVPARQVKWLISRCRFFMGARTHSTIAAVSTGVPTIAIAYSQKAYGIWQDVFGNAEYVVPAARLSSRTLLDAFSRLQSHEAAIRHTLGSKRDAMLVGTSRNGDFLLQLLGKHPRGRETIDHAGTAGNTSS